MKKFFKFLFCTFSLVAAGLGAFYLYKNVISKHNSEDDFDDLDDDFDDFDMDEEDSTTEAREYVPINLSGNKDDIEEETDTPYEADEPSTEE